MTSERKAIEHWRRHWDEFIENALGLELWSGMRLIIDTVQNNQRTSVRAAHGTSKTLAAAAIAVTFFNLYEDAIVITTAPGNRQVEYLLWKEIRNIYAKRGHLLRGNCQQVNIKTGEDSYMIGFSTDNATTIEGFHAPHILWVIDEAKGCPMWLYDSIEGSMTGGDARVLEISTTDGADQQCPLRIHHSAGKDKWKCIKLSAFDSPFVDMSEFPGYENQINTELFNYGKPRDKQEWSAEKEKEMQITGPKHIREQEGEWKEKRPELWETKILGEFSSEGTNNIIPLKWVESAINAEVDEEYPITYGLDIARMGNDSTVLTPKHGKAVQQQIVWGKKNTMHTTGRVRKEAKEIELIQVDACGIGAGVFDRLAELGQPVIGLDSATAAFENEKYANLRAEMWWMARGLFEKQYLEGNIISLPDDPELVQDLTGMKYNVKSDGRIIAEPKEEYKKRLGRSPDKGDSCIYCLYEPPDMEGVYVGETSDKGDVYI